MFTSSTSRASLLVRFAIGALLIAVLVTACSDDDGNAPAETSAVSTTQNGGEVDEGSGNGGDGGAAGGFGTATVTVPAGTLLAKKYRAGRFEFDGNGSNYQDRGGEDESQDG